MLGGVPVQQELDTFVSHAIFSNGIMPICSTGGEEEPRPLPALPALLQPTTFGADGPKSVSYTQTSRAWSPKDWPIPLTKELLERQCS